MKTLTNKQRELLESIDRDTLISYTNKEKDVKETNYWIWFSVACFVAFLILALYGFLAPNLAALYKSDAKLSDYGTFGDMFGAVNALFTAFAFAGTIITLLMQKQEIKMQREELQRHTDEMEESNRTSKKQMEIMQKQIEVSLIAEKTKSIAQLASVETLPMVRKVAFDFLLAGEVKEFDRLILAAITLENYNLQKSSFSNTRFASINFLSSDIKVTFFKCSFEKCLFDSSNFDCMVDDSKFTHCEFSNIDFSNVTFKDSDLIACSFKNCNLDESFLLSIAGSIKVNKIAPELIDKIKAKKNNLKIQLEPNL